MPPEILRLSREYMKDPKEIRLNEDELSLETINQSYLIIDEREKFKHLCNLIKSSEKKQTIVFAATKIRTQRLAEDLKHHGFRVITIHGDLSQKQRDHSMSRFRTGNEDILVATDIAARGIDIPAVGHIINYDVPDNPLIYFHRIGRTARAGGSGQAISLVSKNRFEDFSRILNHTDQQIKRLNDEMGIEVPQIQSYSGRTNIRRYNEYNRSNRNSYGNTRYRRYGSRNGENREYRRKTYSSYKSYARQ